MSAVEDMLEKARAVGYAKGYAEGRAKAQKNAAIELIKLGHHTLEDIAEICELPLDRVKELADSLKS